MRLTDRVYWVGSGALGPNETDPYDCNVFLIDAGSTWLLIDAGAGLRPDRLMDRIGAYMGGRGRLSHIILTHGHADHSGGAYALQRLTGAKIVCGSATARILEAEDAEAIHLNAAIRDGVYPADYVYRWCKPDLVMNPDLGQLLIIGELKLQFIETPGHSHDSMSCYIPDIQGLFCGDAVFQGGRIAAVRTSDYDERQLFRSLSLLLGYEPKSLFPGHLEPVTQEGTLEIQAAVDSFRAGHTPPSIV